MSMTVGSVHNTYAAYASYATQKTKQNSHISKTEVSQEDYTKELQEKNPEINIAAGNPDRNARTVNGTGKTDVRISPKILNKMASDPQIAAKYETMLSKIPALDRWADSAIKAMTGSEVKYRQVWIDDEGNMGSMCITGPSEHQKKLDIQRKDHQKKTFEDRIEKAKEKTKKQAAQLEKMLEEKIKTSKNGKLFFNHKDIQLFMQTNAMENKTGSNRYFDKRI